MDLPDGGEQLLADARRKPERRLVDGEQLRLEHERARGGEHLLLAAGEGSCDLRFSFRESREQREAVIEAALRLLLAGRKKGPGQQIFQNCQFAEWPPALGAVHE